MSNDDEIPLKPPRDFDLATAQVCSFVVNVSCDMCEQWKNNKFPWKPTDSCPVTNTMFPVDKWKFQGPIWSTFTPEHDPITEPFAIIGYGADAQTAFLAFRGSQTKDDGRMDLKTKLVDYISPAGSPITGAKVSEGFYGVFNGLDHALRDALSEIAGNHGKLIVTGHSLGSTLATLTVPLARAAGIPSSNILHYNQASPKVGNSQFKDYYESLGVKTFRTRNLYDVVPDLPPGAYVAVGAEAPYGANYLSEPKCHNPCCSYSYALFNPDAPYNRGIDKCMEQSKPDLHIP